MRKAIAISFVACLQLILSACAQAVIYRSESRDRVAAIEIVSVHREPFAVDRTDLKVSRKDVYSTLWSITFADMSPCFAIAAWANDSRNVVILYRDCLHEPAVLIGFKFVNAKPTNPGPLLPELARTIRRNYVVPAESGDPIAWASGTTDAARQFQERLSKRK